MNNSKELTVDEEVCMIKQSRQPVPAASEDDAQTVRFRDFFKKVSDPPVPAASKDDALTARFREVFKKVSGPDMEVDAWELQEILNFALRKELQGGGFSLGSCKSMVALMDEDRSGKLGFEEFRELWETIWAWKQVFKKYDADNSGTVNASEMKQALQSVDFEMSEATFDSLILRYADKKRAVTFDSFIAVFTKLKFLITSFANREIDSQASFEMNELLILSIYS